MLGAIHSRDAAHAYLHSDVMGKASPTTLLTFSDRYTGLMKSAMGLPMTDNEYGVSIEYYKAMLNRETYNFSVPRHGEDDVELEDALLQVLDGPTEIGQPAPGTVTSVNFGPVVADGLGGQSDTIDIFLFASGRDGLTISDIALLGGNAGFSVEHVGTVPVVLPGLDPDDPQPAFSQYVVTLRYDPSATGAASDVLRIESDHPGGVDIDIPLSGSGVSPFGTITLDMSESNLGGTALTGLARDARTLFVMDSAGELTTLDITGFQMEILDSLNVADGGGEVFVGGGIAYLSAKNAFRGGFATVNVADPANLSLISGSDVPAGFRPGVAVAVDSSGHALAVGSVPNPSNPFQSINVVDLFDVSDPANTDAFLTRFLLPEFPSGVTLANDVALIADGSHDLLVLGYQSADAALVPPTVSVSLLEEDADAGAPGTQVIENTPILLSAIATDDTLVRSVDILVNGQTIATDVSFPYEISFDSGSAGETLVIHARATDVGSNVMLSCTLSVQVIADTVAPTILSVIPADGSSSPEELQQVSVRFSEAIDAAAVTAANFHVMLGGNPGRGGFDRAALGRLSGRAQFRRPLRR